MHFANDIKYHAIGGKYMEQFYHSVNLNTHKMWRRFHKQGLISVRTVGNEFSFFFCCENAVLRLHSSCSGNQSCSFWLKYAPNRFWLELCPRPQWGSLQRSRELLAGSGIGLLRGRKQEYKGKGNGGKDGEEGKGGEGKGKGKGRGKER